ncbi:MAG: hypothetical protein K0R39_330 [Symbiobacteriaceae bacterium]|jgi:hypothetical protein|nr:hypothetical protein [Symbiobacteriaceae bacterium]
MTKKLYYRKVNVDVQKVQTTYETSTLSRRNPPAVEVNRYGAARTNVEGAEDWRTFFEEQGISWEQPWVTIGHSKLQGLIFMYAANKTDPGAIEVKWDAGRRVYTTHYGAAMKECPAVRPVTKVEAQFEPALDKEEKHCLAINIKAAKPKRVGAANAEEMAARAEAEAVKQAVKEAARQRTAAAKQGKTAKGGAQAPEAAKETPPASEE